MFIPECLPGDDQFNHQYISLINEILEKGETEVNERTNTEIKVLPHKVISVPIKKYIPIIGCRKVYAKSAAAELGWTLRGEKNISWLQKYTKMWDKFTNQHNEIDCAYGWRWQTAFGRNQLFMAIDALLKDSTDRQVVVQAWDPRVDGLGNRWSKNVPCPTGFMLNVTGGKLNLSFTLRSSDIVVGLVYDSALYAMLLVAIANELKVDYGQFTIFMNHAHIYQPHYVIAEQLVRNYLDYLATKQPKDGMYVPQNLLISGPIKEYGVTDILNNPDTYVEYIGDLSKKMKSQPEAMRALPEVIE